jgi:glycosyltransferase involved in cell wall biosynthesis
VNARLDSHEILLPSPKQSYAMRVIVVTWLYAPTPTPRAIRWQTLSEEFARAGHRVEVITSEVPCATSSSGLEGLTIHRVGGILGANIGPAIRSTAAEESRETRRVSARIRKFASNMACRIYDASWKKVYWPDRACSWFPAALRRAERIVKDGDCDGIITVSFPFTPHLVGYSIKRRHPALPWIVDVGDPFAFQDKEAPNNYALYRRRNALWERKVLASSDYVSVTNQTMSDLYASMFPDVRSRLRVIPPCAPADVRRSDTSIFPTNGAVRIVYAGRLYRGIRSPRFLLALHRALSGALECRCELHFIGDVSDCADDFRSCAGDSTIFIHGVQSHEMTLGALSRADVLVNIANTTSYQLPSKIVEYAAMGKKILTLSTVEGDQSTCLLQDYPAALTFHDAGTGPTPDQVRRLIQFIRYEPDARSARLLQTWGHRFRPQQVGRAYLDLVAAAGLGGRMWLEREASVR